MAIEEHSFHTIAKDFIKDLSSILNHVKGSRFEELKGRGIISWVKEAGDVLVRTQKGDIDLSLLLMLKNVIEEYLLKFEFYFTNNALATGFVFLNKNCAEFDYYINYQAEYSLLTKEAFSPYEYYFTGLDLDFVPDACFIKYTCVQEGSKLKIKTQYFPKKEVEYLLEKIPVTKTKWSNDTFNEFYAFCEEMRLKLESLITGLDKVKKLVQIQLEEDNEWHKKILNISEIISPTYLNMSPDVFFDTVKSRSITYDGKKLEWFGSKYELYYFIYHLNDKVLKIQAPLKWAQSRFFIKSIREDRLADDLGKVRSTNSKYYDLLERLKLNPEEPLSVFKKELQ